MADRSMQDEMARFEAEISAVASTGSPSIRPAMIPPSVTLMMNRPRGVLPPPPPPPMFLPSQLTHRIAAPQPLASTTVASSGPAVISAAPKVYISKSGSSFAISAAAPTISIVKPPSAVASSISASQSAIAQIPKDVITLPDPTPATPVIKPKPTTSGLSKYAIPNTKPRKKPKKIVRAAGGQVWEDNSLLDWDPDDFRIFCGDLGNDVTDETLARAFGRFPSFQKAKVIRDKRSNKTKGFGFVSFKDPQDFIRAMKEMNGRYVGSRPIKLRKSSWKNRNIGEVTKKQKEKTVLGLR